MKYKALLFGSIGTLIESSNIQRNSFNEAFKEVGLDWYWDEQDYKILLKKSGGTKRVEDFAEKNNAYAGYWLTTRPGDGIIFPSHLEHWVEQNKSTEDRISISFNIRLRS